MTSHAAPGAGSAAAAAQVGQDLSWVQVELIGQPLAELSLTSQ
ncbi:hypothetical protein ABZ636_39520 [Streptomyces sp. NPDC007251]